MMKMNYIKIFVAFVAVALFSGCNGLFYDDNSDCPIDNANKLKLAINFTDLNDVVVRSTPTADESKVQTLTVVFYDKTTGLPAKFAGRNNPLHYDLSNPVASDWEGGTTALKTIILPFTPPEAENMDYYVFANIPAGEITSTTPLADLNNLKKVTPAVVAHPFVMEAHGTSPAAMRQPQDYTLRADLERAVAKLEVVLHYKWNKLTLYSTTKDCFRTLMQFDDNCFYLKQDPIQSRKDDAKVKLAQPSSLGGDTVTTFTTYINEYNLSSYLPNLAPYILLELPANLKKVEAANVGLYPPPAGGEENEDVEVTCFYKIIMPLEIKRNGHYVLHAYIIGPGAPTEAGAVEVKFGFNVLPWDPPVIVP